MVGHLVKPEPLAFEAALVDKLQVSTGFKVNVFAAGLGQPRMMAVAEDGTVYVTRRETHDVVALRDSDGDGHANTVRIVVDNLDRVHGITMHHEQDTVEHFEDFLTEFLLEDGCAYFGRPTSLVVARDGALLISDDTSGVIYRVAYSTEAARR